MLVLLLIAILLIIVSSYILSSEAFVDAKTIVRDPRKSCLLQKHFAWLLSLYFLDSSNLTANKNKDWTKGKNLSADPYFFIFPSLSLKNSEQPVKRLL